MADITIWTDGSANNHNHNRGGYGIVILNGTLRQYCGGQYINTTSARMELLGAIRALEKCEIGDDIVLWCDNQYVVNLIARRWLIRWTENEHQFKDKKNKDLLIKLLNQYNRLERKVKFKWLRGHTGHEMNELADALAYQGSTKKLIINDRLKQRER